ncbi:MAG: four helix bundle protein [Wenzhouxiangella sp.]|jgi:four helix bundle protein|nr:four helix bundle protein [Wenzhouxiangella sp.]
MTLGHEKLDVYRLSIEYVAWVFEKANDLNGIYRPARDQWLRASQSVPLNIAEGNGKTSIADRRRFFEIARGSALECAAVQDVLVIGQALLENESQAQKVKLDRIAMMLSRMAGRGYRVGEQSGSYLVEETDVDFDCDFDFEAGGDAESVAGTDGGQALGSRNG